jgi:hypothetical protein
MGVAETEVDECTKEQLASRIVKHLPRRPGRKDIDIINELIDRLTILSSLSSSSSSSCAVTP